MIYCFSGLDAALTLTLEPYCNAKENETVNLTCITDVSNRPIDWYYNPASSNDRSTDVTIYAFNKMHLKWNKNNIEVTNGGSSYVLTIHNITKADEGIYICFDHASFGERSYTNVTVLGKFFHNVK